MVSLWLHTQTQTQPQSFPSQTAKIGYIEGMRGWVGGGARGFYQVL